MVDVGFSGRVSVHASYYLLPQQMKSMGGFLRESRGETKVPAGSGGGHPVPYLAAG